MAVGLSRNSVFALVPEVTEGTPVAPSSGAQFVPLRPGYSMAYEVETLDNEELLSDIGAAKPNKGKESVSGSHDAYLKSSGVAGTPPELDAFYLSVLGSKSVASTEYDTVAASTTAIVKVGGGEGATFEQGEALLVKDGSNGYSIRNIASISTDDLQLNYLLPGAPALGVNLGKAVLYKPGSTFQSFTGWLYNGNGFATEMSSGNQITELSMEFNVNEYASASFSYAGIRYHFNPIQITAGVNDDIDFEDDQGVAVATVPAGFYRTPQALASALQAAMDAATTETITVSYSNTTGRFTIAATGTLFELPFSTGTNTATSIKSAIGFASTDLSAATTYTSDAQQVYTAPYTPSYDSVDPIVVKDAELFIGTQDQNICVCARTVSVTISKEVTDADCICEETGTKEKVTTGRTVTLEAEFFLNKYDSQMVDQLINNDTVSAMLNVGPKSGGNWVAGKCVNVYLKNAAISAFSRTGDEFVLASVTVSGFVSSTAADGKDVYLNFL